MRNSFAKSIKREKRNEVMIFLEKGKGMDRVGSKSEVFTKESQRE